MSAFDPFRNAIKESYGFSDWGKRVNNFRTALSRGFLPKAEALAGYEFENRRPFPNERHAFIDYYRSIDDPNIRIAVTVTEYATIEQAHEGLVNILSTCMAPSLPRTEEKGINAGDIGFAGHDDLQTGLFFARSNILIKVESVGVKQVSVKDFAESIDQQILAHINVNTP